MVFRQRIVLSALATGALVAISGTVSAGGQGWQTSAHRGDDKSVVGSGRVISRDRRIGNFNILAINGPVDVVIRQGRSRALTLVAEDNIMELVRVRASGNALLLDTEGSFRSRRGIRAVLTVPSLDKVAINASGDVRFNGWTARDIELVIAGSGDIELGGQVDNVQALIRGSGNIDLSPTRLSYVEADIGGSGKIRMGSLRRLDATIDGSGTIEAGAVGELDAVLNGSGDILYRSADRILRRENNGSGRIARH